MLETSDKSIELAASAWQKPETSHIQMDPVLAQAFAEILDQQGHEITAIQLKLTASEGVNESLIKARVDKIVEAVSQKLKDDLTASEKKVEENRKYIHDLETRCDPAGDVQRMASLKEQVEGLTVKCDNYFEFIAALKRLSINGELDSDNFDFTQRKFMVEI